MPEPTPLAVAPIRAEDEKKKKKEGEDEKGKGKALDGASKPAGDKDGDAEELVCLSFTWSLYSC